MKDFILVITQKRTYKNILFILVSFILSNIYFIFFTTGFSLSFGLSFILIGIPLFVLFLYAIRWAGSIDASVMNYLLDAGITDIQPFRYRNIWHQVRDIVSDDVTWKRLVYIFVKYPIDIVMFAVSSTMLGTSLALIVFPVVNLFNEWQMLPGWIYFNLSTPVIMLLGLFLLIISMHIINLLTMAYLQAASHFLKVTPKRYAVDLLNNA